MYRVWLFLVFVAFQSSAIDHQLVFKALNGDKEAKYQVATMFGDRSSDFYSPIKAHDMFLSMAREGDTRTFYWLATSFANPMNDFYGPSRAQFYLSKVEGEFASQKMLYDVLAGDESLGRLSDMNLSSTDPYLGILNILKHYPFHGLTVQQTDEIKHYFDHPSVADFEPYVYPALITPTIANTPLYGVETLEDNPYWMKTDTFGHYRPLSNSNGVRSVKVKHTLEERSLLLQYASKDFNKIVEYYASFLTATRIRNGRIFKAPGVSIVIKRNIDATHVTFTYEALQPLIPSLAKGASF